MTFWTTFGETILTSVYTSGIEVLLFIGLALKVSGFLVRDEMILRALVTGGMVFDIAFYGLRADPIVLSIFTNTVMASINFALIVLIVFERTTLSMTPEARRLFRHFPSLTPGHFRFIYRHVEWRQTTQAETVLRTGTEVTELYCVMGETYTISKCGAAFAARGPAFVGEIALLTDRASSATVELPPGTRYAAIPFAPLRKRMKRSRAFHNSMVAVFSEDLAAKVANSVPMASIDQVAAYQDLCAKAGR
ncbi:hypothetical protein LA6_003620 [Marinibacterium anthonyi]|nr:hypothetical protein LA6_003620 [Marinibacterium anthonyi]